MPAPVKRNTKNHCPLYWTQSQYGGQFFLDWKETERLLEEEQ